MQQVTTIQPSSTPGGPVVVTTTQGQPIQGVPTSHAEYRALMEKRSELSSQLISASGRRDELAEQLKTVDPDARPGLRDRLQVLDERIVKLEQEIDRTGVLVANTPPHLTTATRTVVGQAPTFADRVGRDLVPLAGMFSVFVLLPLAIAVSRLIWRRTGAPRPAALDAGTQQQLHDMQQSIDAIAIEVERISEGQRFVTRMMSDRGLGAGAAEPVRQVLQPPVRVERD